jgi:hypothetical protein
MYMMVVRELLADHAPGSTSNKKPVCTFEPRILKYRSYFLLKNTRDSNI